MDKIAYKSLKTNQFSKIKYTLNKIKEMKLLRPNVYSVDCMGGLEISGVLRSIETLSFITIYPNEHVFINGSFNLKMSDFKITPPVFWNIMRTGDNVKITYLLHFYKPSNPKEHAN